MRKNRLPPGDDGRTISNMNVEGMPWYSERSTGCEGEKIGLSRGEMRSVIVGALGASLLVALTFAGAFAGFILFLELVIFR